MEIIMLLLPFVDGAIVAAVLAVVCQAVLGDSPAARALRLLACAVGGIGYCILGILTLQSGTMELSTGLWILLAPVGVAVLLAAIGYIFGKKDKEGKE